MGFQLGIKTLPGAEKQADKDNDAGNSSEKKSRGKPCAKMAPDRNQAKKGRREDNTVFGSGEKDVVPVHSQLLYKVILKYVQ